MRVNVRLVLRRSGKGEHHRELEGKAGRLREPRLAGQRPTADDARPVDASRGRGGAGRQPDGHRPMTLPERRKIDVVRSSKRRSHFHHLTRKLSHPERRSGHRGAQSIGGHDDGSANDIVHVALVAAGGCDDGAHRRRQSSRLRWARFSR